MAKKSTETKATPKEITLTGKIAAGKDGAKVFAILHGKSIIGHVQAQPKVYKGTPYNHPKYGGMTLQGHCAATSNHNNLWHEISQCLGYIVKHTFGADAKVTFSENLIADLKAYQKEMQPDNTAVNPAG